MTASMSSAVIIPGRRILLSPASRDNTVDSMPTCVGPASRMHSTASPSPSRTCPASVGDTFVNGFALGAAIGTSRRFDKLHGYGMRRHANSDAWQTCRYLARNQVVFREDKRERSRPKMRRKSFGSLRPIGNELLCHLDRADVNNQRTRGGPALRRINALHSFGIESVGP